MPWFRPGTAKVTSAEQREPGSSRWEERHEEWQKSNVWKHATSELECLPPDLYDQVKSGATLTAAEMATLEDSAPSLKQCWGFGVEDSENDDPDVGAAQSPAASRQSLTVSPSTPHSASATVRSPPAAAARSIGQQRMTYVGQWDPRAEKMYDMWRAQHVLQATIKHKHATTWESLQEPLKRYESLTFKLDDGQSPRQDVSYRSNTYDYHQRPCVMGYAEAENSRVTPGDKSSSPHKGRDKSKISFLSQEDEQDAAQVHTHAWQGDVAAVRRMVESGDVDVNERDRFNNTPLHFACAQGHMKVVEALLALGCSVNARNHLNETALHVAAHRSKDCGTRCLFVHSKKEDSRSQVHVRQTSDSVPSTPTANTVPSRSGSSITPGSGSLGRRSSIRRASMLKSEIQLGDSETTGSRRSSVSGSGGGRRGSSAMLRPRSVTTQNTTNEGAGTLLQVSSCTNGRWVSVTTVAGNPLPALAKHEAEDLTHKSGGGGHGGSGSHGAGGEGGTGVRKGSVALDSPSSIASYPASRRGTPPSSRGGSPAVHGHGSEIGFGGAHSQGAAALPLKVKVKDITVDPALGSIVHLSFSDVHLRRDPREGGRLPGASAKPSPTAPKKKKAAGSTPSPSSPAQGRRNSMFQASPAAQPTALANANVDDGITDRIACDDSGFWESTYDWSFVNPIVHSVKGCVRLLLECEGQQNKATAATAGSSGPRRRGAVDSAFDMQSAEQMAALASAEHSKSGSDTQKNETHSSVTKRKNQHVKFDICNTRGQTASDVADQMFRSHQCREAREIKEMLLEAEAFQWGITTAKLAYDKRQASQYFITMQKLHADRKDDKLEMDDRTLEQARQLAMLEAIAAAEEVVVGSDEVKGDGGGGLNSNGKGATSSGQGGHDCCSLPNHALPPLTSKKHLISAASLPFPSSTQLDDAGVLLAHLDTMIADLDPMQNEHAVSAQGLDLRVCSFCQNPSCKMSKLQKEHEGMDDMLLSKFSKSSSNAPRPFIHAADAHLLSHTRIQKHLSAAPKPTASQAQGESQGESQSRKSLNSLGLPFNLFA